METKKTAIDWLKNTLEFFGNKHELVISWDDFDKIFERAKAMEKEQIMDAFGEKRQFIGFDDNEFFGIKEVTGKEYYNETYGN